MSDKARTAAPAEIYLQGYVGSFHDGDVTWCDHPIDDDDKDSDTRYLRAPASGLEPVPCPACKSSDVGGAHGVVQCYKCLLKVKHETTALATLAWNARAPLVAQVMLDALTRVTPPVLPMETKRMTVTLGGEPVGTIHVPADTPESPAPVTPRRSASEFMQRFAFASPLDLWAALEKLAPSGGAWRRNKNSLAHSWQDDDRLAGVTLDAIQEALP